MTTPDWPTFFDEADPRPGCSEDDISWLLYNVSRPLDKDEVEYLSPTLARNPWPAGSPERLAYRPPDPRSWPWPSRGLPLSYLSFLRWSNGGIFGNRRRRAEFIDINADRSLGTRNLMLAYLYPMSAPHVVPFAYDLANGGAYYGFDTADDPCDGELPVVYVVFGGASWERMEVATGFVEFCRGADESDREAYWEWFARRHGSERP